MVRRPMDLRERIGVLSGKQDRLYLLVEQLRQEVELLRTDLRTHGDASQRAIERLEAALTRVIFMLMGAMGTVILAGVAYLLKQ